MIATYTAKNYSAADVQARYVRIDEDGAFRFVEVGADRRFDLRQGFVDASELPETVKAAALDRAGMFPSYVAW